MLALMFLVGCMSRSGPNQDSLLAFADIANYIYENPTLLDLSLQGIWISDRACLSITGTSLLNVIDLNQRHFRGMSCKKRSLQWTLCTNTKAYFPSSKILAPIPPPPDSLKLTLRPLAKPISITSIRRLLPAITQTMSLPT